MSDGFVSGSLSIALSALIAAALYLSLPSEADRDDIPQNSDEAVSADPSAALLADEQKASIASEVESVTLPPPPVLHQPDPEKPTLAKADTPSDQAELALMVKPLQPAAPKVQPPSPIIKEPLRPSLPASTPPAEFVAKPLQLSVIDEKDTQIEVAHKVEQSLEPAPLSEAALQSASTSTPNPAVITEGRILLRILEHGSGPSIEITWPVEPGKRRQLYRRFESCFSMQIALMDEDGSLFIAEGIRGQSWDIDLDRHSGFVRQTTGQLTAREARRVQNIRAFHGNLGRTASVRVFPRRMDAILLGGLRQLIGSRYGKVGSIRASYRIDGDQILVEAIEADGELINGYVGLSGAANSSCRYQGVT